MLEPVKDDLAPLLAYFVQPHQEVGLEVVLSCYAVVVDGHIDAGQDQVLGQLGVGPIEGGDQDPGRQ